MNLKAHFTDDEIAVLRRIIDMDAPRTGVYHEQLAKASEITHPQMVDLLLRMERLGLIGGGSNASFHVMPRLREALFALDNPPPINHVENWQKWFFSCPCSPYIYVLFIGLPALVGYITTVRTIYELLIGPKK